MIAAHQLSLAPMCKAEPGRGNRHPSIVFRARFPAWAWRHRGTQKEGRCFESPGLAVCYSS